MLLCFLQGRTVTFSFRSEDMFDRCGMRHVYWGALYCWLVVAL